MYNWIVRSDYYNKHRSTKTDPLPGGLSFFEEPTEVVIHWGSNNQKTESPRRINAGPAPQLAVPDDAVVGETELRKSAYVRVGLWMDAGGWLVLAWNTEGDTTLEEQTQALERAERSAKPMMWIGGSKANMYWRKDGTHSHTRIALGAEAVGRLGEIDPDLPRMLLPKRFSSAYRIQGSLCQIWIPL